VYSNGVTPTHWKPMRIALHMFKRSKRAGKARNNANNCNRYGLPSQLVW
jgi:hypothetical protein